MNTYVGLDVSLRNTSVCVVDEKGSTVIEKTVLSDPDIIVEFIDAHAPAIHRVGLESGPTSIWLWRELAARNLPVICIDARHAKAALSMQINKSDRNDAVGIARIMQTGWYRQVQIKSSHSDTIRALLNSRALLVRMKRDIDNQVRGLLKISGLVIGQAQDLAFSQRVHSLLSSEPLLAEFTQPLMEVRISKCGNAMVRTYWFDAAGVLLTREQKWCALKAWGLRIAKRSGMKKARIAVARKLAVILLRMWRDNTEFQWTTHATH